MTILLFIFLVFLGAPATAARHDVMEELFTHDELRREAGYGDEKLSNVVVSGSVLCDFCLDGTSVRQSHPIPGASVAVSCDTNRKMSKSDWVRGRTDEYGDFVIDLPSHLHAIPNMEKICIVKVLELPKSSPCHQAFMGEHTGINLASMKNGFRTYTAHEIYLTPKDSQACMKKQATF
ncbi:hypothetical protein CTI12_AA506950 [Artemisia annua]|uniref:Pollen Ole e 1 allergen and extensin family protein n=1 Tax=Artemisia annua TaxID=35608 RepID=A0A2U1L403_ARTAN|nr:hypothetical protein CTI12_AA506950 [Artemisia annua]